MTLLTNRSRRSSSDLEKCERKYKIIARFSFSFLNVFVCFGLFPVCFLSREKNRPTEIAMNILKLKILSTEIFLGGWQLCLLNSCGLPSFLA